VPAADLRPDRLGGLAVCRRGLGGARGLARGQPRHPGRLSAQVGDPRVRRTDGLTGHRARGALGAAARRHRPGNAGRAGGRGARPVRGLGQWLDLLMFVALCGLILLGFPVAFTLAGTALIFAGIGYALGVFDPAFFGFFPNRIYGIMTNEVLIAVPLFVFMGVMLERSKVAEELLDTMGQLF